LWISAILGFPHLFFFEVSYTVYSHLVLRPPPQVKELSTPYPPPVSRISDLFPLSVDLPLSSGDPFPSPSPQKDHVKRPPLPCQAGSDFVQEPFFARFLPFRLYSLEEIAPSLRPPLPPTFAVLPFPPPPPPQATTSMQAEPLSSPGRR